jgi:hypothetical protein
MSIYDLHILSDLLPIIVFILFFNRNKIQNLWVVFIYSISSSIIDFLTRLGNLSAAVYFYSISSFTVLEYSLFSIYFYFNYSSSVSKSLLKFSSLIFFAVALYNIFLDSNNRFDTLPASIESILIICYSILYFYEQLKRPEITFIYSTKTFWIIIAILLYLSGTFILFISTAYMTETEQKQYWPINSFANITKNILLSIAFMLKVQEENRSPKHLLNL